jgi:hypothetical protein
LAEVLGAAHSITQIGVLRYLDHSRADIALALEQARDRLADAIPLREGVDRNEFRRSASAFDRKTAHADLQPGE